MCLETTVYSSTTWRSNFVRFIRNSRRRRSPCEVAIKSSAREIRILCTFPNPEVENVYTALSKDVFDGPITMTTIALGISVDYDSLRRVWVAG